MNSLLTSLPDVTAEDLAWVTRVLALPKNAFTVADGSDSRLSVIREFAAQDVEACPGSGKTTLLVAKLAILARHWTEQRRGICVLSHTNVARKEIENRLGSTLEGKRLLSYPHFVGTIHGFVNEFLALPWLRSNGLPVKLIDDEISLQRRWHSLPQATRIGLERNKHSASTLRVASIDFSVGTVRWGNGGTLGTDSDTYRALRESCRKSCMEGYFCHDEMFLWAVDLLDRVPAVKDALRGRFPLLFIDEVQDTDKDQAALLQRLFLQGDAPVVRQRFGDSNQAIYQSSENGEKVVTDPFPNSAIKKTIQNSYRFGKEIADLADPIAVSPVGLIGLGPSHVKISSQTSGKHAIFVFNNDTVVHVISRYAAYLTELFSDSELQTGTFTAVGAVHRPAENTKIPRSVTHYWPDYDHRLSAVEPRPVTFLQYIAIGRKRSRVTGEAHHTAEKIAEGVLRLATILNPDLFLATRKRNHQFVLELLASKPQSERIYLTLVADLLSDTDFGDAWETDYSNRACEVAAAIAGTDEGLADATEFLATLPPGRGDLATNNVRRDNIFRFPTINPKVHVRVGSIHSVKGETHTSTMVLDTFFYSHHLATLKPWLLGEKSGGDAESDRLLARLRQHYVALTRPSHLLCLAMREDALSGANILTLKSRGWRIARVEEQESIWL